MAEPTAIPLTIPVPGVTLAMDGLLLDQNPPDIESVSADVLPRHNPVEPEMADGPGLTVTDAVTTQPVGIV